MSVENDFSHPVWEDVPVGYRLDRKWWKSQLARVYGDSIEEKLSRALPWARPVFRAMLEGRSDEIFSPYRTVKLRFNEDTCEMESL